VAHPTNPQVLYATTEPGIYVTQDAGASWVPLQSGKAPQSTGGFTIPYYFNGTAFNSVATVVHENEPLIVDPTTVTCCMEPLACVSWSACDESDPPWTHFDHNALTCGKTEIGQQRFLCC
jgi:hypothetical protein